MIGFDRQTFFFVFIKTLTHAFSRINLKIFIENKLNSQYIQLLVFNLHCRYCNKYGWLPRENSGFVTIVPHQSSVNFEISVKCTFIRACSMEKYAACK